MRKYLMKIYLVLLICLVSNRAVGQVGDSILANETTLIRPLNVHKGQLRISGGYSLLISSTRYDAQGNKIDLSDEGFTNIGHMVDLEFNYGFTEFLQASMGINHLQQAERSRGIAIVTTPDDPINFNEIIERKGWSDIDLTLDFKAPFVTRQFDLVFSVGRSLPVAAHEPEQPEHQIENSGGFNNITYRFLNKAGQGTGAWILGVQSKIRANKLGFTLEYSHRNFPDAGSNISWRGSLDNDVISYSSSNYDYQLGDQSRFQILSEYQAWSFLNIFLGYQTLRTGEGWTEITGVRALVEEQKRSAIELGAEVLVTPRLWIRQVASFPVGGENSLNPLILSTRASYNLFPFN